MGKAVESYRESIPAYRTAGWLSTGYLEGLKSVFSDMKRKARSHGQRKYGIAIRYFIA